MSDNYADKLQTRRATTYNATGGRAFCFPRWKEWEGDIDVQVFRNAHFQVSCTVTVAHRRNIERQLSLDEIDTQSETRRSSGLTLKATF